MLLTVVLIISDFHEFCMSPCTNCDQVCEVNYPCCEFVQYSETFSASQFRISVTIYSLTSLSSRRQASSYSLSTLWFSFFNCYCLYIPFLMSLRYTSWPELLLWKVLAFLRVTSRGWIWSCEDCVTRLKTRKLWLTFICGVVKCRPWVERTDVHLRGGISEVNSVGLLWYFGGFLLRACLSITVTTCANFTLVSHLPCMPNLNIALSRSGGSHSEALIVKLFFSFSVLEHGGHHTHTIK